MAKLEKGGVSYDTSDPIMISAFENAGFKPVKNKTGRKKSEVIEDEPV